ncbi:MAG: ABC transporter substrate-binding protein [Acidimicrobiales bacterium]
MSRRITCIRYARAQSAHTRIGARLRVLTTLIVLVTMLALSATTSIASATRSPRSYPSRIVSLSPTATEMLFAIGAGHQVVAVDEASDYPKDAPHTSLSGLDPNVEAIAKYRPQLVVISYNPSNFEQTIEKLGVKVLLQDAPSNLAGAYAQIDQLGQVTGHVSAANALVARMKRQIRAAVRAAPHFSKAPRYFYELDQGGYSVTSTTFVGKLLAMFGLRDIADAAKGASDGYPDLSTEYIVKSNPNLIFLADTICCHQSLSTVAKRPGYRAMAAVRDRDVFGLNDDIASRWGPRVVVLAQDIEKDLWLYERRQAS